MLCKAVACCGAPCYGVQKVTVHRRAHGDGTECATGGRMGHNGEWTLERTAWGDCEAEVVRNLDSRVLMHYIMRDVRERVCTGLEGASCKT